MTRLCLRTIAMAALVLSACAQPAPNPPDPTVHLTIVNLGREPIQCRVMFGHWVDRDLGIVGNGDDSIVVELQQQPADGALYVMRDDGQRRMMVENIFCARKNDWQASVGQIELSGVRMARATDWRAGCLLPDIGRKLFCTKPQPKSPAD